jgi:hypothetical protein
MAPEQSNGPTPGADMLAIHAATTQGLPSIQILVVLIVIFIAVFWKVMLQILAVFAAAMLVLGAVTLFSDLLHLL